MAQTQEEWRDIPGFNGMYQINYFGDVRSWIWRGNIRAKNPKLMTAYTVKGSSRRKTFVKLRSPDGTSKRVPVASIMADVWLGGTPPGMDRIHIDGACGNNCANNIKFVPHREAAKLSGGMNRRPVVKVNRDGEAVAFYPSIKDAAKANFISEKAIRNRCCGQTQDPYHLDGFNYQYDE